MNRNRLVALSFLASLALTNVVNAMLSRRGEAPDSSGSAISTTPVRRLPDSLCLFILTDELFEGTSETGTLRGEIRSILWRISNSATSDIYTDYKEILNKLARLQGMYTPRDEESYHKSLLVDGCWAIIQEICKQAPESKLSLSQKLEFAHRLSLLLGRYSIISGEVKANIHTALHSSSNLAKIGATNVVLGNFRTISREILSASVFGYSLDAPATASTATGATAEEEDLYS